MTKFKRLSLRILAVLVLGGALYACSENSGYDARLKTIESNKDELVIALAWPLEREGRGTKMTILDGASLAMNEINAAGGLKDGRKIVLKPFDDERKIDKGLIEAERIAEDKSIFAVIGHLDSYISLDTSTTYEVSGLLVLNPGSTDARLTKKGHKHLFRLVPKNDEQGEALANYFKDNGISKVLLYSINNAYGHALAKSFSARARASGVDIITSEKYYRNSAEHRENFEYWEQFFDFDAIFLAGSMPEGADIIRIIRETGIDEPIFAGAGLDSTSLIDLGGQSVEDVNVISFFPLGFSQESSNLDPGNLDSQKITAFSNAYEAAYEEPPVESAAALGYDAVKLIAHAVNTAGTLERGAVAKVIRDQQGWLGVAGQYKFDDGGDPLGKLMVINKVKDGEFRFSERIQ
ncbi:ABC transporter substrate-binding protein [Halioglobus sp. HI00S01]|uniref:ABC transporter substrate-binding protein n=1 Tax=Halioglobus sp. HI00S01 TaxID=1822214 RepID=UPI0018D49476|nr:ABC transporter substrate-binding protein [Halioglobus sp. HI00S01]